MGDNPAVSRLFDLPTTPVEEGLRPATFLTDYEASPQRRRPTAGFREVPPLAERPEDDILATSCDLLLPTSDRTLRRKVRSRPSSSG